MFPGTSSREPDFRGLTEPRENHAGILPAPGWQYALLNNAFFPIANQAGFDQTQFSMKSDYLDHLEAPVDGSFVFVDRPRTLLDQGGVWDFSDPNGGPLSRARLQWVSSHYARIAEDWTISPTC